MQARDRCWEAITSGAGMSDEKKKSKIGEDPNPQLPPPPLSRARLAAKIEKVFEESLPVPIKAAGRRNPISEEEVKQRFADAAARGAKIIVSKALRAQKGANPLGRPRGEKPPKTLAERQQAFRDRKRKEKK